MLIAFAKIKVEIKFGELETPGCDSSGTICKEKDPFDGVVIRADCKQCSFEVWL